MSYNERNIVQQRFLPLFELATQVEEKKSALSSAKNELTNTENKVISPKKVIYPTKPHQPILGVPRFFNKKRVFGRKWLQSPAYAATAPYPALPQL